MNSMKTGFFHRVFHPLLELFTIATILFCSIVITSIIRAETNIPMTGMKNTFSDTSGSMLLASSEEEDAFGNIMYTTMLVFVETDASEVGSDILFRLVMFMRGHDDEEEEMICTEASAFVTADLGATWHTVSLSRTEVDKKTHHETWEGRIARAELTDPDSANDNTPVIYFFRAKDNFGNISTELPDTAPGWPPNPAAFFPGTDDIDNSEDIVPDDLDLLKSFVARDENSIYIALNVQGRISKGNMRSRSYNFYATKFTNPDIEIAEGLMVGRILGYNLAQFQPPALADIDELMREGEGAGRLMDSGLNPNPAPGYGVAMNENTLFQRIPIVDACGTPKPCELLSIVLFTASDPSDDSPIPNNAMPYLRIYLRTHTLDGYDYGKAVVSGATGSDLVPPNKATPLEPVPVSESNASILDKHYREWLGLGTNEDTPVFYGSGPFTVRPGDIVFYKDYHFEVYTRNGRIKVRIVRKGQVVHTIMIGKDTRARRDEQHKTGNIYVTLKNFNAQDMTCTFVVY